jgi:hypothetical protein
MVFDLPRVVDAQSVSELDLIESILKEFVFIALAPGSRQLMLVKNSELHGTMTSISRSQTQSIRAGLVSRLFS